MNWMWLPAYGLPLALGFVLVSGLTGGPVFLRFCLGLGAGLGAASCLAFPFLLAGGLTDLSFLGLEAAALAGLGVLWRVGARSRAGRIKSAPPPWSGPDFVLAVVLAVTAVLSAYIFWRVSIAYTHGDWDAWNNWNMIPRFIVRGEAHWLDRHVHARTLEYHPYNYPMLVALSVARFWKILGAESVAAPIALAFSFTAGAVGLVCASISSLRSRGQAFLAAALLAGTPNFINIGSAQYADVPLGFFYLAALVSFCLMDERSEERRGLVVLAGLMTGLACWTKNEGQVFLIALVLARAMVLVGHGSRRRLFGEAAWFFLGLLPGLATLLAFKLNIAQAGHFREPLAVMASKFIDLARHKEVALYMLSDMGPLSALAVYFFLLGPQKGAWKNPGVMTGLAAIIITLTGYYLQFVCLTPQNADLHWYLALNSNRLVLQLWPGFIVIFFLLVSEPDIGRG